LVCDGVLLSTAAGSTAYNLSAHGPILPLDSAVLALTPISPFRPRRWRGAIVRANSEVKF
jgi:NAD+ kinase